MSYKKKENIVGMTLHSLITPKMELSIFDFGLTIYELKILKDSNFINTVVKYKKVSDYLENEIFLNCIVGRVAGRIKKGKYFVGDQRILLKETILHSGTSGLSSKYFELLEYSDNSLLFGINSSNKFFPGIIDLKVKFTINNYTLTIEFDACSNITTLCNITMHPYFNLSNNTTNILTHKIQSDAKLRGRLKKSIPISYIPTEGYFNLIKPTLINNISKYKDSGLSDYFGFDHPFQDFTNVKIIYGQINLKITSSYSDVVIYTNGQTNGQKGKDIFLSNFNQTNFMGIAVEPQLPVNDISHNVKTILNKGEKYKNYIQYSFEINESDDI